MAHAGSHPSLLAPHARQRLHHGAPRRRWAAEAGHLPGVDAPVRFVFDGDQLQAGDTPAGLDLEGDECIDVYF
jgi:hypothetical protein